MKGRRMSGRMRAPVWPIAFISLNCEAAAGPIRKELCRAAMHCGLPNADPGRMQGHFQTIGHRMDAPDTKARGSGQ